MSEIKYKPSEMADAIMALDPTKVYLTDIDVVTPPNNINYLVGDTFDPTGIMVEGNYSHDFKKNITNAMTYSPTSLTSDTVSAVRANYTEKGVNKYSDIYISVFNPSGVSWSSGSNEDLKKMVQLADKGKIDLTEYWGVGDERTVHINVIPSNGYHEHASQDVVFVIVDKNCENYTYTSTPSSNREHPFFIIQQKDCLIEPGYAGSGTASYGWDDTSSIRYIRRWCSDYYYKALPSEFADLCHQVTVQTTTRYNSTNLTETDDYIFLASPVEILHVKLTGSYDNNTGEYNALNQFEYYKNNSAIKHYGIGGNAAPYWCRTTSYGYSNQARLITATGTESRATAGNSTQGLAPCFAI